MPVSLGPLAPTASTQPLTVPDDEGGNLAVKLVLLATGREVDGAAVGVTQIDLAANVVVPGRGVRVLKVGHEGAGAAVQRVDDHLAVHGAGDLDAAVDEARRRRRTAPVAGADVRGLRQKVRQLAGVNRRLPELAAAQQLQAAAIEVAEAVRGGAM